MRTILRILTALMVISIVISFVAFMMDWEIARYAVPVNVFIFVLLLAAAVYNNYLKNKKFREFLLKAKQDKVLKNEPGRAPAHKSRVKTGEYSHFKSRRTGLTWTGGTVHGAVPKRGVKKKFLSRR